MTNRTTPAVPDQADYAAVHTDIVALLESARSAAARSVNALMTASYWEIGRRIVEFEQAGKERAEYGQALLKRLSADLSARFGRGFSERNLEQMRLFYLSWPLEKISQTASAKLPSSRISQTASVELVSGTNSETASRNFIDLPALAQAFPLPWSAYVRLLSVKNEHARSFYEAETLRCGWSVRQLDRQVNSQFYERTALSHNKAAMLQKAEVAEPGDAITPEQAIKDPFVLEFLNLKDEYSESDLEDALIQHLADFLLELGDDFAFVGRQRRLRIDDSWFRVDVLFFHRSLKCLLVIDLKVGKFSYADAGQMHLYLNYARQHWMKPGENPPVGLILCAEKGAAEAHYTLEGLSNKVLAAEYQTVLPDEKLLAEELDKTRRELEARRMGRGGDAEGGE
jgi:predicted nuclease of restriction endonuclease-like (RecB) superfamily